MSIIERPSFYEGQILAAADLQASVAHARNALARHERLQHTYGIVDGLALTGEDRTDAAGNDYKDLTLGPGMAVDTGGRQIVVTEPLAVEPDGFQQVNGADVDEGAWYPLFLRGKDTEQPATQPFGAESCGSASQPSRVSETATIEYGRLGDVTGLPDDFAGDVGQGPPAVSGRILVGYVKWSIDAGRFAELSTGAENGVAPARAGLAGDEVAAHDGRLELRTRLDRVAGTPTVRLDTTDGGRLAFGFINGTGGVDEVFSVDAAGNIDAEGSLSEGTLISGSAHVASGIATDGVVLPLPAGVTQQDVDDGTVVLHTQVTPLTPGSPPPTTADTEVEIVVECEVDADRRVRCRTRWINMVDPVDPRIPGPAACNYLVIAAVPASGGA
ncbi:MAG: hypothetical protein WBM50_01610 [Acidimicrobiales bacterium]